MLISQFWEHMSRTLLDVQFRGGSIPSSSIKTCLRLAPSSVGYPTHTWSDDVGQTLQGTSHSVPTLRLGHFPISWGAKPRRCRELRRHTLHLRLLRLLRTERLGAGRCGPQTSDLLFEGHGSSAPSNWDDPSPTNWDDLSG